MQRKKDALNAQTSGLLSSRWFRMMLIPVMAICLGASAYFALKSYRTFVVLEHSRALDVPEAGNLRAWMTLDYIANSYPVSPAELSRQLELPPTIQSITTLRELAESQRVEPLEYVQRAQKALAALLADGQKASSQEVAEGWLAEFSAEFYSALLRYGYPILALTLLLGALGLPVPAGPLTAIAGGLALQGDLHWAVACAVAVTASVIGDALGFVAGRMLSPNFLDRWGHWFGYTRANRLRLERLYQNWGGMTLILTRSLIAYIGVLASILAGAGRYPFHQFFFYSVVGRLIWTGSYFGAGYAVGTDFEVASGFLGYVSMLLISLAILFGAGMLRFRHREVVS